VARRAALGPGRLAGRVETMSAGARSRMIASGTARGGRLIILSPFDHMDRTCGEVQHDNVVVMDVSMPGMNGTQITGQLRVANLNQDE
jgi:CheY-like chemotaxis protein